MSYENILIEKKNHIGIITLNRPNNLNTFNIDLAKELNLALEELDENLNIRVIIVKGAGKAFCAGIDLNELKNKTMEEYYETVELMEKMSVTISNMKKPVITSVHNIAVANGIGLVASSDLTVASEDTRFGATAVKVGLFCMGPAVSLSKCLGRKKALELLLTGDLIDAKEAERIGLINKVVSKEKLEEETMKLAKKIASYSPKGVQAGKQSFYSMIDLDYEKALELTNNHFATLCTTKDAQEGIDAFLNKRDPKWKSE
ncbi:MAG: enoyl-CoA hydratase/isomerase family protein [Firmicutes bacterium]|nr:enoyl-CoA hydratase/isomerase family protein [Bacillota bacterium]